MVGGGGKKKGKSAGHQNQQQQQQVNNNNNKGNNVVSAASVINKDISVPVVTAFPDPETNNKSADLQTPATGGDAISINNTAAKHAPLDDSTATPVRVNNVANNTGPTMETPTVSAAGLPKAPEPPVPKAPRSLWANLDSIEEFHPTKTALNINATAFSPSSQTQAPPPLAQVTAPAGYGGVPVAYQQQAPLMPNPLYQLPYGQQLYKPMPGAPGTAPFFYMPAHQGPSPGPPAPPAKHIMNRGAPGGFEMNAGYPEPPVPQIQKQPETIQIRLDDSRKGAGKPVSGAYTGLPFPHPYLMSTLTTMSNQVRPPVMQPVEPVNVSAASLSDVNTYPPPGGVPLPVLPPVPYIPQQPVPQPLTSKPSPSLSSSSFPPPALSQQHPKRPSPPPAAFHPPIPPVELPPPTPAPAPHTPVTQVKPVAEIKIKSVMKVEEDEEETEEVTSSPASAAPSATDAKALSEALDKVSLNETVLPPSKKESSPPQVTLLSKKSPSPQPAATPPPPPSTGAADKKQSPPTTGGGKDASKEADGGERKSKDSGKSSAAGGERKAEDKAQSKHHTSSKPDKDKDVKAASPAEEPSTPLANNKDAKPAPAAAASKKQQGAGSKAASEEKESPVTPAPVAAPAPAAPSVEKKEVKPSAAPASGAVKPPVVVASPAAFDFKSLTNLDKVAVNTEVREQFRNSLKTKGTRQPLGGDDDSVSSDPNRKRYSRNQLLELQNKPESIKRPDGYNKSLDIFDLSSGGGGGGGGIGGGGGGSGGRSSSSNFSNMVNFGGGMGGDRGYMHRGSQSTYGSKDKGDFQPMIIHSVSLKEEVKLKTTENAWKASALKKDPTERVVIDARSLLNKLSPENFDSILGKFVQLKINNDNIDKIIDLITFKAVWEPKFSEVYAKFISELDILDKKNNLAAQKAGGPGQAPKPADPAAAKPRFDIRGLLLKKFQGEFNEIVKTDKEAKLKSESLKQIADPKEREDTRLQYEDEDRLNRKKSVGMMIFIGELFKLRMLHPKVLHSCFEQLLQKPRDVENLECLTKLIMSTGKSVEELNKGNGPYSQLSKEKWNEVIPQVRKLVAPDNKNQLPSRIRFMILDVLDLKDRGWVPRMAENKPKTMAQIEKDIEQDAFRKNMQLRDDDSRMGMSKPTPPGKKPQQGGSNQQAPPVSTASQKITVDVSKFQHVKEEVDDLSLRPPTFGGFGGMGAGQFKSATKTAPSSSSTMRRPGAGGPPPPITQQNSFSVLSGMESGPGPQSRAAPGRTQPSTPRGGASTPSKSKQPAAPAKPAPPAVPAWIARNDNAEFERKLGTLPADQFEDKYSLEDQYMEYLQYGEHFTDKQEFAGANNQYREEVSDLMGKCLNRLHEPLLSWSRLEAQYARLVDKMETEINSLGADKFDPRGLTRSLLIDLLGRRPAEQNFVTAFLISILARTKKWGGDGGSGGSYTLELLKDFVVYCTKSDIRDDFPNVVAVLGDLIGYLVVLGTVSLDDYRTHLLVKYVEDVSSKMFVRMVHSIARLQGAGPFLFPSLSSLDAVQSCVSPLTYRAYSSFTSFDPLPAATFRAKFVELHALGWLLDRSARVPAGHPLIVNAARASSDELGLVNLSLHYFVAHSGEAGSSVSDYLSLNFGTPSSPPASTDKDLWFALTQKIAYESLDPSGTSAPNEDGADLTYKLNEARFRALFQKLVAGHLAASGTLDQVLPCLFALLDINIHMQLPMGLLQSQFVIVKETLLDTKVDLSLINAQFTRFAADKTSYHEPASRLARPVSTDIVVQESGYSKTSALLALANFFKEIENEEAEVSGDDESGGEESAKK